MVHPLDLLEWGWSPEWFFISPFLIETAISKNLVKKKIQGSGNVVVKYIAVFLSIFMFESVWIWAKTTRCFRCQGAWLWVIYSPLRNIVCVYVQTWIYIYAEKFPSLELENVGGWYLWKTVQIKRGGKRTLAEHLQLSICRGQSLYRGDCLPWSSHQVSRVRGNLALHQGSETPKPQLLPKATHTAILILLRCCPLYCGDFPPWMFMHSYCGLDFLWYC